MKTNIERLIAAVQQVDNSVMVDEGETHVAIDGWFHRGDITAAIDEHLVPLHTVIKERPATAMFLRTAWAEGTTDDGREFEIASSGVMLILSIGPFGDTREVYTIDVRDLAPAWLRTVGAGS